MALVSKDSVATAEDALNEVVLRGRVTSEPVTRELPSGTSIVSLRISVGRARTPMTTGSRQNSDWVDCVAWTARTRRSLASWRHGDTVEVHGSLRRRFLRGGQGNPTSRLEVEVLRARVIDRAGPA